MVMMLVLLTHILLSFHVDFIDHSSGSTINLYPTAAVRKAL